MQSYLIIQHYLIQLRYVYKLVLLYFQDLFYLLDAELLDVTEHNNLPDFYRQALDRHADFG